MELKILGIWKEFGWGSRFSSIFDYQLNSIGTHSVADKVINYLSSGIRLASMRGIANCPISGDLITSMAIYTDGYFVWTEEYIHYLKNGIIKIDQEFLSSIHSHKYLSPVQEEFSIDRCMSIYDEIESNF